MVFSFCVVGFRFRFLFDFSRAQKARAERRAKKNRWAQPHL
jgi:hypothetical protein